MLLEKKRYKYQISGRVKIFNTRPYSWLIYTILWCVVWGYPLLFSLAISMKAGAEFSWHGVLHDWDGILPFFLLFLLHRLPIHFLFMRYRVRAYVLSVIGMLCIFGICHYYSGIEVTDVPFLQEHRATPHVQPPMRTPDSGKDNTEHKRGLTGKDPEIRSLRHPHPAGHGPAPEKRPPKPLMLDIVIAALLLGFDLAVAILSRYQENQEKARRLETEHLRYELDHLKAQINPHFFMNMLNNIHGMVELNPTKAQVMIMELSQLMRYVLYEGAKTQTTLCRETEFINNYVELMRKRYSSQKVRINLELPDGKLENIHLPPLLFINIIENAFKHGISYQSLSFVDIRLFIQDEKLHFYCTNSIHNHSSKDVQAIGVGLANLRQRLQLLYGDGFTLGISEKDGKSYQVKLVIPYEYDTDTLYGR